MDTMNYILYFFTYSFLGWIAECIYCGIPAKKFINRGFLAGPYCPIYGCGAMVVIHLLQPWSDNPLMIFLIGIVLTSTLEYLTSFLMEKLFHTKWWDYSKYPFNLHGRVCLKNSLLFGILVLAVFYLVHPGVIDLVDSIPSMPQNLLAVLISLFFLYDIYNTVHALLRRNAAFAQIEDSIKELRDAFKSTNIFPLTQPLTDKVQAVLNSTNADEILIEHIERLKTKYEELQVKRRKTYDRLSKAFPTKVEEISRKNAERLMDIIRQHRRTNNEEK